MKSPLLCLALALSGTVAYAQTSDNGSEGAAAKVYWTDSNNSGGAIARVLRATRDGTETESLITPGSLNPRFIAVDLQGGQMYWTDVGRIDRARLDGTGLVTLVDGLFCPLGIALDLAGGQIYWTDCSTIKRANLVDGSGVEDVVTGLGSPRGLALDLVTRKMYWTDPGTGKIQRANLDGSGQQDLITDLFFPQGIALDLRAGQMYWPDNQTIYRASLDGTSREALRSAAGNPIGIALDLIGRKMYWADAESKKIQRANLDGSSIEDLVSAGLDTPWGIALSRPAVAGDVDGDARTDVTVWRPGDGSWYALRSSSANQTFLAREWGSGLAADVPVPGDYDGDGRRDFGVWRRENGVWYVLKSSANYSYDQAMTVAWGLGQGVAMGADVPVPGDYDGDGRTDPAVWRPDSGTWYILRSAKNYSYADAWVVPWGASFLADIPVPADYDGDGRTDIAVWRPGSGIWFILKSTANYAYAAALTLQWGAGAWNDRPVVGDYDGDGRADAAVWRPNPGVWYILKSSQNYSSAASTVIEWGAGWLGDIPVVGDYDGDGSSDLTVWRPDSGAWYILKSSAAYADWSLIEWGAGSLNDIPNAR